MIRLLFFLSFLCFLPLTLPYPYGAGSCRPARNALGGPHLYQTQVGGGQIADHGLEIRLDGKALVPGVTEQIQVGTSYNIDLVATNPNKSFRGFLVRLESYEDTKSALNIAPTASGIQVAEHTCVQIEHVGGLTHTNNNNKQSVSGILRMEKPAFGMFLDVTVVVRNAVSGGISEYYYSEFTLDALESLTSPLPTPIPTSNPTKQPTPGPTFNPTKQPTAGPTPSPTKQPTAAPTPNQTPGPTQDPTFAPTPSPTRNPTPDPTPGPTRKPTTNPTTSPTPSPTNAPTQAPTRAPTASPTAKATASPKTQSPTLKPTGSAPSPSPTGIPTKLPTNGPSGQPSKAPTPPPTPSPTKVTQTPSSTPSNHPPSRVPTSPLSGNPSSRPSFGEASAGPTTNGAPLSAWPSSSPSTAVRHSVPPQSDSAIVTISPTQSGGGDSSVPPPMTSSSTGNNLYINMALVYFGIGLVTLL